MDKESVQLTYKVFHDVLKKWDAYVFLELNKMSRDMGCWPSYQEELSQGLFPPGHAVAEAAKLSELAPALWEALKAGPDRVDAVHDEMFADAQVEHFRESYKSVDEVVAGQAGVCGVFLPSPIDMFLKLGKPAQLAIVKEDLLQKAMSVWNDAKANSEDE